MRDLFSSAWVSEEDAGHRARDDAVRYGAVNKTHALRSDEFSTRKDGGRRRRMTFSQTIPP